MKVIKLPHVLIGLAMLAAAGLALVLASRLESSDQGPQINLETMIPRQFGEWKLDETVVPLTVSPGAEALRNRIYNQTLTRNYVNGKGELIMLAIAYGGRQSTSMQVHRPEMCYPAQGFEINTLRLVYIPYVRSRQRKDSYWFQSIR